MRVPVHSRARTITALFGLGIASVIGGGLITLLLLFGSPLRAGAAPSCTDTYNGASGGSWNTATNWSTGLVPGPTSFACLPASDGTITYSSSSTTIETLLSVGSATTLSVTSGNLTFQDTEDAASINALTVAGGNIYVNDAATITTLAVTSGSLNGSGAIAAGSVSWTGGNIGTSNPTFGGTLSVSGQTTLDLSTTSSTSVLANETLVANGPTAVEAAAGAPGFQIASNASLIFGDTTSTVAQQPTIAEGETIYNGGGSAHVEVESGVTLNMSGTSGSTTSVEVSFDNHGTVNIPASGTLSLTNGGTSTGPYNINGGILAVNGVVFEGPGTEVNGQSGPSGTATFEVNASYIESGVSVNDITSNGNGGTTYFYDAVASATVQTGASSSGSNQENLVFYGPVTTTALDVYGASLSGTAPISTTTFTWDAGYIGNNTPSPDTQAITVSGQATIDLSTQSTNYSLQYTVLQLNGPSAIEAPVTDPGFQVGNDATLAFGDTTSTVAQQPTIAEGETIYNGGGNSRVEVESGVTLNMSGTSGSTTSVEVSFDNLGTVNIPASGTLSLTNGGTSTGPYNINGGILAVNGVVFEGPGTEVNGQSGPSGTATFEVNASYIESGVSVNDITSNGNGGTTYFYDAVASATVQTGASSSGSNQENLVFYGPVTTTALDVYGASLSGTAPISTTTFTWDAGYIGNNTPSPDTQAITVSGQATIDLSTQSTNYSLQYTVLQLNGPSAIEAPVTDPGFQVGNDATLAFGDTTSTVAQQPTIAEGETIYNGGGNSRVEVESGVTLNMSGTSGSTTSVEVSFDNLGTVNIPASGTLSLTNGGTSTGPYNINGGILAVNGVVFEGPGTEVNGQSGPSGTATFEVNASYIESGVSVNDITSNGNGGTTYFYDAVASATVQTGASSSGSNQENLVFYGPVTTTALDVYGASLSGTAPISTTTFTWDAGYIGNNTPSPDTQAITVSGQATIDLSTQSTNYSLQYTVLQLNGPSAIEAPVTDPGFQVGNDATLAFGDTTSTVAQQPTIAEGETIYNGGGNSRVEVESGVTLNMSGTSGSTTSVEVSFDNHGTVNIPASGTLSLTNGGTSTGPYNINGGILAVNGVVFEGPGTEVNGQSGPSGTATFEVNASYIESGVSVNDITSNGNGGTTYFYDAVASATVQTGTTSGNQENLVFYGPVTTTALDVYGASLSGTAPISTTTFTWDAGYVGSQNSSNEVGTITVSGQTTISLSTQTTTYYIAYMSLVAKGPTAITTTPNSPGFELAYNSSIIFADNTSGASNEPTIASGVTISNGGGGAHLELASGVTMDSPSSGTTNIECALVNHGGTLMVPAGATLNASSSGYTQLGGKTSLSAGSTLQVGTSNGMTILGGTLNGTGTVTGNVNAIAGTLEGGTGTAAGVLTVSGAVTLGAGATLAANLDGTSAGATYSQVVAGSASLAGTLKMVLTTGYSPAAGSSYTVIGTSSTPTGSFGQLTPTLLGTKAYSVSYSSTGAVVTIPSGSIVIALRSSSPTSAPTAPVTFTATVVGSRGSDRSAWVTFYDGTHRIGSGPVAVRGGVAAITTTTLATGKHVITARYYAGGAGKVVSAVGSTTHTVRGVSSRTAPRARTAPRHTRPPGNRTRRASGLGK